MKNSIHRITCVASGIAMLCAAHTNIAVASNQGFSVTPGIGFYKFDDDLDLEDEGFANLGLQYQFNNNFALEGAWGQSETESKYSSSDDIDFRYARLDALYYFNPQSNVRPYLAVGAGEGELELDGTKTDETLLNIGGGINYLFAKSLAVRADLRAVNSSDNETTSGLATVALSYLFGGQTTSSEPTPDFEISQIDNSDNDEDGILDTDDQCINTPTGISVDSVGCPVDTDADGIADFQDSCKETAPDIIVNSQGCAEDLDKDGIADYLDRCPGTDSGALTDEYGCKIQISDIAPTLDELAFAVGSAEITSAAIEEVKTLATFMQRYDNTVATIEGHSDSSGNSDFNKKLSEERAQTVRGILIEQFGIDPERVKAIGFGEARPIATNDTLEGRAKNRRVDTKIEMTN